MQANEEGRGIATPSTQRGGKPKTHLATAIASPSHELSPDIDEQVRARLVGVLSPMGDFSHSMTVRQLVDLHAYLRSVSSNEAR